jgi:hypothetical protein
VGEVRNAYNIMVGKPEKKRLLGRPRYRWEDNIRMLKVKVKDKVVPVLFFYRAPRYEGVLGEWRCRSTHPLTPALYGGEGSASRPNHLSGEKKNSQPLPGLETPIIQLRQFSSEVKNRETSTMSR